MSLLQMSVRGGALILLIMIVRALALHRLPKTSFPVLWEVAALRLLVPFSIPLPFGIPAPAGYLTAAGNFLTAAWEHLAAVLVPAAFAAAEVPSVLPGSTDPAWLADSAGLVGPAGLTGPAGLAGSAGLADSAGPAGSSGPAAHMVLQLIWLAGFVLAAAYFLSCYVRAMRKFRASCPDNTPAVQNWLQSHKLRRPLEVRQSGRVSAPLTYGIFRPVILLPKEMARNDETALTYILTHEFIHIRRFDAVTKLIFTAVLCVHWFNPLVWVMAVLANRDLELSCDECVINAFGGRGKASYALTLIAMAEIQSRQLSVCNHFGKLAIEERIKSIMKYKKTSALAAGLAVVLVLGATTAFAASAQADDPPLPGGQSGSLSPENLMEGGSLNTEGLMDDSTLMSYYNPGDGKTYYSWDNGQTFEPMTDEEVQRRFAAPKVEWWTYEEYAAWLENEKVELQAMLGEKGRTGGRGDFVWTQEIIDETIAMYESILQEIKEGKLYSKSVDGDPDTLLISGGADSLVSFKEDDGFAVTDADEVQTAVPEQQFGQDGSWEWSLIPKAQSGLEEDLSSFHPARTDEEWQQILDDIKSGKIPPFEIPGDPNVTVSFVHFADGSCVANN